VNVGPSSCCPPSRCPSSAKTPTRPRATPPIEPSPRLNRFCPACPPPPLCCRPKWRKTDDDALKLAMIIDYKFPCLPEVSCRYKKWIRNIGPQVETNLCASRFSSKRNSKCIADMPVNDCQPPCPCHCPRR